MCIMFAKRDTDHRPENRSEYSNVFSLLPPTSIIASVKRANVFQNRIIYYAYFMQANELSPVCNHEHTLAIARARGF